MNHILKNITLIFANLGIFPDSNIKLGNTSINYEEVEVVMNKDEFFILRDGYYPELIKNLQIFIKCRKNGKLYRDNKSTDIEYGDKKIIFEYYYQNMKFHRDNNKPALIKYEDGKIMHKKYYQTGNIIA